MLRNSLNPITDPSALLPYDDLIRQVAEYVYHYEPDSSRAVVHARATLVDALGCAIESLKTNSECAAFIGPIVPETSVPNGFKLPGTAFQLDPAKGAFDLSSMIRYLDHNDAFPGAEWGHPSDNIGAILSVCDWRSRALRSKGEGSTQAGPPMNIRTVLHAMIKAYEIQGCYQIRNAFNAMGLDHTILVKIASTAVVAWLIGLSEVQAIRAVSHAWIDGHALRIFRQSPNAGPRKGWAAGDAAMRAVHLCLMMRAGQPGIPTALTDPNWGFQKVLFGGESLRLPRPFQAWVMEGIFFKLIPAEGHGISAVEAALRLAEVMAQRGLDPANDISRIKVRTHEAACKIIDKRGPLSNAADRDHCMRYMIAVVLLKGSVIETMDYSDSSSWAYDQRVEALRNKIDIEEDKSFTEAYHDRSKKSAASGLTISLIDGSTLDEVVIHHPIGHPERTDTIPSVKSKARKNLGLAFNPAEIETILAAANTDTMPVSDFVDLLHRPSAQQIEEQKALQVIATPVKRKNRRSFVRLFRLRAPAS